MIVTVEEVQAYWGIVGQEQMIAMLIALAEDDYLRIRNKPFDVEYDDDDEPYIVYPTGAKSTALKMVGYHMYKKGIGLKSESLGDWSASYLDSWSGYPSDITGAIKRFVTFV